MVVSAANYITGNLPWPRRVYARDARREHARGNVKLSTAAVLLQHQLNNNFVIKSHILFYLDSVNREKLENARVLRGSCLLAPLCAQSMYVELCSHGYFRWVTCSQSSIKWQFCLYWLVPIAATSMHLPKQPSDDYWINEFNLWEESKSFQYLHSFLRAVPTFFSAGFLHEKPKTNADLTLVLLLQILGSLIIWILIARVNQLYKGTNSSKIKYQDVMAEVKRYMRRRQLPYLTQRRIVKYYEFYFQHQYFSEAEILNTLSSHMRQEIGMHACRKLVENVTFFNNLPLSLITRIVALLKSEIFLPNDVIVRANELGNCMYFIANGTVAIYTSTGKEVCHLEDGAHFGEIALVMLNARRVASVVAVEICVLYSLDRADFAKTIHPYPMLWEQVKKIAIERHERTATNLFFHRTEECRKQENFDGTHLAIHGSVVTSSCHDGISPFSDVKRDKYLTAETAQYCPMTVASLAVESRPFDEKQWFARIDAWAERTPMTMNRLGGLAIVIGRRCACLVAPDGVHALAYPYCRARTGFEQKGEH
ncbi:Potassium/sodium hyperpolarization-activated cyclic nucleotide-gated channel 4 [Trachymyrmex septentrionalis]|uniref:Potassium/sodium hyperpolarization-activated cyclic nucleotide-gated channel 4 n=1 Tax=Trachymyrmex septentrionalis TaxID=34720 RepID=A0A195F932_9HYME|nr:Potassium/sodium hyperpolarization-activated cyclic nucleotide-gated channel 4 [Trachymyrmex septentrionalis]